MILLCVARRVIVPMQTILRCCYDGSLSARCQGIGATNAPKGSCILLTGAGNKRQKNGSRCVRSVRKEKYMGFWQVKNFEPQDKDYRLFKLSLDLITRLPICWSLDERWFDFILTVTCRTTKTAQCKIRSYATRWTISIPQESSSRTSNTDTKRVHRRSINAWQYPRPKDWPYWNDMHDVFLLGYSRSRGLSPETMDCYSPKGYKQKRRVPRSIDEKARRCQLHERHSWRGDTLKREI